MAVKGVNGGDRYIKISRLDGCHGREKVDTWIDGRDLSWLRKAVRRSGESIEMWKEELKEEMKETKKGLKEMAMLLRGKREGAEGEKDRKKMEESKDEGRRKRKDAVRKEELERIKWMKLREWEDRWRVKIKVGKK